MDHTYAKRKSAPEFTGRETAAPAQKQTAAPVMSLRSAPEAGSAKRLDLSDAIRTKMENAFGTDLSAVRLYESEAVAEHGAGAVAQGNTIAFAPGLHDFSSRTGQEILGHELSHVVSQRRGEVTGSGFLNNAALEARADREGAMAAAGEQVYDGPVTGPLSGATADAAAAGPMQAWDKKKQDPGGPRELGSGEEAYKFFDVRRGGEYERWFNHLRLQQQTALYDYTSDEHAGNYLEINDPLRSGQPVARLARGGSRTLSPKEVRSLRARRREMDSAIARSELHEPIVVHRGSSASLLGGLTDPKMILERFGGRTVRDRGFMSTSAVKSGSFDGKIHYKITVPAGKGCGTYLAPFSQHREEEEYLLRRNSEFVVKNAYKRFGRFGQTIVEMEMKKPEEEQNAQAPAAQAPAAQAPAAQAPVAEVPDVQAPDVQGSDPAKKKKIEDGIG